LEFDVERSAFNPFHKVAQPAYKLVKLANGAHSVHSLAVGESFHPAIGPVAEAEALYVRQVRLVERLQKHSGEFVIWDVGLGAAANALTALSATKDIEVSSIHLCSFDSTFEPLEFALQHRDALGYFDGYEGPLTRLIREHHIDFTNGKTNVSWSLRLADFPSLLREPEAERIPKPHLILFDPFSPAKNPAMWTLPVLARIFQLLDPIRPCVLANFSRSTIFRVTLLLAGFFVGVGQATGTKEETTVAANALDLIETPLNRRWLERAKKSDSAEPLHEPVYRRAPLGPATWEKLWRHPQFNDS
jgi:tRNA U34 5-methylaminomethyl-2-thiouridine-forming methyltransferase MnmC